MDYRREIDGLRALAVLPVILFHAGFQSFSGGFVGVDVFFVISGYLITAIIAAQLQAGTFSLVGFYERRARRILPALFLVMFFCLPAAWLLLFPQDMRSFSQSLIAVCFFASNWLFWQTSGYFEVNAELKPLLHTWSLAVEEQYYLFFPILLMLTWRLGKRWILGLLAVVFILSLALAQWGSTAKPEAAFYLLPTRGWELLIGAFIAFYSSGRDESDSSSLFKQAGAIVGLIAIAYAIFVFDKETPFPSLYTLVPTLGTALIIMCATHTTLVGKLLGNQIMVSLGLISYSAYLWHQPLFAFAKHQAVKPLNQEYLATLSIAALVLAYFSWRYVEVPFRNREIFNRKYIFWLSTICSVFFLVVGFWGVQTNGFKSRYELTSLPKRWDAIKCHGASDIAVYKDPLSECLGATKNEKKGDIFLIGDSHAAQLTFPLKKYVIYKGRDFNFVNTENLEHFPYSFWLNETVVSDPIIEHILKVTDSGDVVVVAFHRGYLNEVRDAHIPMSHDIKMNNRATNFYRNMDAHLPRLLKNGIKVYLVKDAPLLSDVASLEKCAYLNNNSSANPCSVQLAQDIHTRRRQQIIFDDLAKKYPDQVIALDVLPTLYQGKDIFNPINADGTYKMFDRHHLVELKALELLPYFREVLP